MAFAQACNKNEIENSNFATIIIRALPGGVDNPFDRRVASPVFL
jgi:hypothetical protein